jgi:WD40 repeat protein
LSDPGWAATAPAEDDGVSDLADSIAVTADARYLDVELAGAGGMGMVMVAHDRRLGRNVALKRVAVAGDDAEGHRRLAREAQITARLEHPGIVPIYDAGVGADGRSYYAMRLIRGRSLAEVLADTTDAEARLALVRPFLTVCQAVAYAHRHRVLHLDLKPTNVMIAELGETLVVDWGLARVIGQAGEADRRGVAGSTSGDITAPAPITADDARLDRSAAGTPAYLSPERARGEPAAATADVWSLGAILVEILTGHRMVEGTTREILALLGGPGPLPQRWPPGSPPELCAIASKALAWSPADRYPDAEALSLDVAAYLDGRRVGAHTYTAIELARRLLRAWRWRLIAVASTIVATIVVLALSRDRIAGERSRAVDAERRAQAALQENRVAAARALDQSAIAALVSGDLATAEHHAVARLAYGESVDARGVLAATRAGGRPMAVARVGLPGCSAVVPDDDAHALCVATDEIAMWRVTPTAELRWRRPMTLTNAIGLRGQWVVAAEGTNDLVLLDGATGATTATAHLSIIHEVVTDRDHRRAVAHDRHQLVAVDPDLPASQRLGDLGRPCDLAPIPPVPITVDAVAVGSARTFLVCSDGRVLVLGDGRARLIAQLPTAAKTTPTGAAAVDADEQVLAIGRVDGELALLELATGEVRRSIQALDERITAIEILSGAIVVIGERGGARAWNRTVDAELLRLPQSSGAAIAISGDRLITGGTDWWRWSLAPPPTPRRFRAPAGLAGGALSPDGKLLVAARGDGHLSVWSTTTGALVAEPDLADVVVKRVDFSPDGRTLVAALARQGGTIALDTSTWRPVPHQPALHGAQRVFHLADDELIAVHYTSMLSRWVRGLAVARVPSPGFIDGEPTADRSVLWLLGRDGNIERYRAGALTAVSVIPGAEAVAPLADGRRYAVARASTVELHDIGGGAPTTLVAAGERVLDVAVSPDDRWLAAATVAGSVEVWSLADGRWVAHLRGHQQRVAWVAFAGGALWSASWDGAVLRWDPSTLAATPESLAADAAATWALR